MIVTKNTPINNIVDGEPIYIDKEASLDKIFLEFLFENFPNSNVTISTFNFEYYSSNPNALYSEEELSILVQNANLAEKYNRELTFDDDYTLEQAIIASRELNRNADYINNMTVRNIPLSPLEKFTLAYNIVANKAYNNDPNNQYNSRNIISTLSGDKIVCTGFASELNALCMRIGIHCAFRLNSLGEGTNIGNHATCIVNIKDEKYGVDGIYVADPTGDCLPFGSSYTINFNHFLLTHDEYNQAKPNNKFDSLIKINPEDGFVHSPILYIENLYPNQHPKEKVLFEFFNPTTHTIDFEKVRAAVAENIAKSFPKNLKSNIKNATPPDPAIIKQMLSFHLYHTISSNKRDELPPLTSNYHAFLNQQSNAEDIFNALFLSVDNISEEEILKLYSEYLVFIEKGYSQVDDYIRLSDDVKRTKPISNSTLQRVIKKALSVLSGLDSKTRENLATEIVKHRENFINKTSSQLS